MAKDFDIEKFNNDPSFEKERTQFDLMFAGAIVRAQAKAKKDAPVEDNFFDSLFRKNEGGE